MKTMEAKIIKVGNSYGVRLKKSYVLERNLKLGDPVKVELKRDASPSNEKLAAAVKELQSLQPFRRIKNPAAWQQQIRSEWDEREKKQFNLS